MAQIKLTKSGGYKITGVSIHDLTMIINCINYKIQSLDKTPVELTVLKNDLDKYYAAVVQGY